MPQLNDEATSLSKRIKIIFAILFSIVLAGAVLVCVEALIRGDFQEVNKWITENYNPFILNYLIVFVFFLLFLGIFNDFLLSTFVFFIFMLVLAYINRYKAMYLGENLYPWDVFLYQQLFNLLPELIKEINIKKAIVATIGTVLIFLSIIFVKRRVSFVNLKIGFIKRIVLIFVSLGLMVSFFLFRSTPLNSLFNLLQITNMNWNQATNYKINGFVLSFVLNTESALVFAPQGYGEENINNIVKDIQKDLYKEDKVPKTLKQHPNIIFVMSESFWDPTQLKSVSFSEDPMPTIRKNQSGWLLSPQFGGGTSNIEFEALTGLSVSFLPTGSIAYQQFLNRPIPSLPKVLAEKGYEPTAIHPYYSWFWNRENVYKYIGFNEFISLNNFKNAEYKGPYISDNEVNKKIISKTEETEKPDFIYAVTMQNHGPYEKGRYKEVKIKVDNKNLSEEARNNLETYTQGVKYADEAFSELIQYYEKSDEPTIIVFYGDHLPFLGADYLAYKEAGFINPNEGEKFTLKEYHKMRTTPLVVWTNYLDEKVKLPSISPSFLAPHILDLAQIEKPLYYRFLQKFNEKMPGYTSAVKNDFSGILWKKTPDNMKPLEDIYLRLQYDMLFGKQYGEKALFDSQER